MLEDIELINFIDLNSKKKEMVLLWRNHPNVRKWMYTEDEIILNEHLNFIENLKNRNDKLYFVVKKSDDYIGVVDFTKIDRLKKSVYFGFYANPDIKIVGIGRVLEEVSIDYIFNVLKLKTLKLEVFSNNKQVRNLHKKYGFYEVGKKIINDKEVICMELRDENS